MEKGIPWMRQNGHYTRITMTDMRIFIPLLKALLLASLIIGSACAREQTVELPRAEDLKRTGAQATKAQSPILLVVVSESCPYCVLLEEEILVPMQLSGEYEERVQLRVLNQSQVDYRRDFDGKKRSPEEIADRYGVDLVPTMLILGPDGQELAERLIGINVIDFYWAYLELAIQSAEEQLEAAAN